MALYSIITAGLLSTTLASGALAVSAANLAAVGAIPHRSAGIAGSDASRNLLVKHNSIFLLSVVNKRHSCGSPWVKVLRKSRTMSSVTGLFSVRCLKNFLVYLDSLYCKQVSCVSVVMGLNLKEF